MNTIIKVSHLITQFGQRIIHDDISFEVGRGEIFGILGGSGSGKSTLLRTLLFLNPIKGGEVFIFDENVALLSIPKQERLLRRCGVLFQFGALFSSMSVLENVGILLSEYSDYPKKIIDENSKMWLSLVGLPPHVCSLYPYELSGGMKKRVALARALSLSPEILFLDEPTSGLDPASSEKFDELILKLRELLGITIVMVTHDLDSVRDCMDRFIVLEQQKIVFDGTLASMSEINSAGELFECKRGRRIWKKM
ncbi:ABC transporter ATP-binding protein [Helicobacter kayseriensis]|uniref:ABC transporter ATP-binding protein n=1 Tax=Helicobacter kayseriensis TaxID=2905877 RepID=UPI001E52F0E6|nr:ATP-binding cassette domain-containing protein [Helicobacter kayseriensis]MCE3048554.1 ATP-binding cassette domain-containing protein [Helicobacter kayseriensis]